MTLLTLLEQIESRANSVERLPYKEFPLIFLEFDDHYAPTERVSVMNGYIKLGYSARTDIPNMAKALKTAIESLQWIMPKVHQGNHEGDFETCSKATCQAYRETLAQMLKDLGGEK